jgi:lipopolysaccharide/colanic/teichoic acid biosynthesis glycosyltransferase
MENSLMKVLNYLFKRKGNPRLKEIDSNSAIYPVDEFRKILTRARAQADRNGHCFSVVVFESVNRDGVSVDPNELAKMIGRRIRATDAIGWFDEERIGIYLFDMPSNGAHKIAQLLCQQDNSALIHRVYTYPYYYLNTPENPAQCDSQKFNIPFENFRTLQYIFPLMDEDFLDHRQWTCNNASCENPDIDSREYVSGLEPIFGRPIPFWKRSFDIFAAGIGILLLIPLFLIIAVIIKAVSPGPVFFRQQRVGYLGKRFTLWKFRTMHVQHDATVHREYMHRVIEKGLAQTKLENDPHIIPLGRFLRASGLDELPQLINVLRGEMSLIGPRPPIPYEVERYHRWFHGRFDTRPGLTGLWQVSGKNRLSFNEMVRLDINYKRKYSALLDLKILLRTPLAIWTQIVSMRRNIRQIDKSLFRRVKNSV